MTVFEYLILIIMIEKIYQALKTVFYVISKQSLSKVFRYASYLQLSSLCFEMWSNVAFCA